MTRIQNRFETSVQSWLHLLSVRWLRLLFLPLLAGVFALLTPIAQAEVVTMPLSSVAPVKTVRIKCVVGEVAVPLPIPARWKVNNATLRFAYVNSKSLLPRNSQLIVRLNGETLAQIPLDPQAPEGFAEVVLPAALLKADYNMLVIAAAQRHDEKCQMPCAPELWTELKLGTAELTIDYNLLPVPMQLSSLSQFIFDAKVLPSAQVHLITDEWQDATATLAGIVASGVALRFDYRRTFFTRSSELSPDMDNILVGDKAFVEKFMKAHGREISVDSPLIKIETLPASAASGGTDLNHALLIVSGRTNDEVLLAAKNFDILSVPFPDTDTMKVFGFSMPDIALYSGEQMLEDEKAYDLKRLRYNTSTFRGFNPGATNILFRLPPDFHISPNQYVRFLLDFSYGAGLRKDSVLNVLLNGNSISAIQLENEHGGLITKYEIVVPTHFFNGGANMLTMDPVMTPLITENCSYIQPENLFFTLYDTSSLQFPPMPHRVELPRLELMFLNGFPYTRWPDGFESTVFVASAETGTQQAALNLIGLISQLNGHPLFNLKVTTTAPAKLDGELIAVGALPSLPKEYLDKAPVAFGADGRVKVPYPVYQGFNTDATLAFSTQSGSIGQSKGLLMQLASPLAAGRTLTVLTAANDNAMLRMSEAMLDPAVNAAIKGDLAMVDFRYEDGSRPDGAAPGWRYQVNTLKVGKDWVTGDGGKIGKLDYWLSAYPWLYALMLAGASVLLAGLAYWYLRRVRARRLDPPGTGSGAT